MYSTKVFNPKVAESYLNIGDPYSKRTLSDGRIKGKQFQTTPSKSGQLAGFFSPFAYATDSYQDSNKYIITQPRDHRKLGFGTHDANRRDEFTLDIRAKQYRELMQQEKAWEQRFLTRRSSSAPTATSDASSTAQPDSLDTLTATFQSSIPTLQYDLGRTAPGVTPDCPKCERDTFYCHHRLNKDTANERRRVDVRSHYTENFGKRAWAATAQGHQQFTHKSSLTDFFDSNHLTTGRAI